jgi:hypothetical protein
VSSRRGGRGVLRQTDAAEARQLDAGIAQVDAGDEAEEIHLHALDPAELDAQQAPQARLDARAAVGQADIGQGTEVAADRIRRQDRFGLRDRAQHGGDEGVAVRSGPNPVVAGIGVIVTLDRGLDLRDCVGRCGALKIEYHLRLVAKPQPVRRPAVDPHRIAPADHVVAPPAPGILGLEHDPGVHGKHALPATGAAGHDQHARLRIRARIRQAAGRGPIGVSPAGRAAFIGKNRGAGRDRQQEQGEER